MVVEFYFILITSQTVTKSADGYLDIYFSLLWNWSVSMIVS